MDRKEGVWTLGFDSESTLGSEKDKKKYEIEQTIKKERDFHKSFVYKTKM